MSELSGNTDEALGGIEITTEQALEIVNKLADLPYRQVYEIVPFLVHSINEAASGVANEKEKEHKVIIAP